MSTPWYVVQCKANQDARAELELGRQGFEVYRPQVEERRRGGLFVTSYFPRYLFLRLSGAVSSFATVRSTRGVLRMVAWGGVIPTVPDSLIEALKQRTDERGCVDPECRAFDIDQEVRVVDGPFQDLVGRCCEVSGNDRVVLLMTLLQRELKVAFPLNILEPV